MTGPFFKSAIKVGLITFLPFGLLNLYLALHKLGKVGPVPGLTYEATLILNLMLYWLLGTALVLFFRHRSPALGWLRSQAPQVALLAFSILLSAAFGELAIRLLRADLAARPFERLPSSTLHHVNAPNRSSLGMGNQRVITNADGFRTSYDRDEFLEHSQRIVILGDSYAFGLGVAAPEAVGSVLEQRLRASAADRESVAVLSTGVISYSPFLERQIFVQRASAYKPTLTLLMIDANDIGDDHQYAQESVATVGEAPRFDVPALEDKSSICDLSALCRALGPLWDRLGKPFWVARRLLDLESPRYDYYDFEVEIGGRPERNRFFILRYPMAETMPFLDSTWANIEAIAQDVRNAGSDFALVVMPRYFHWNDDECPLNWESDRYGVDEPHENVFLEYFDLKAPAASFPVWSLLPPFAQARGPLVFSHDPHWNAEGHRVAAEALAGWLIDAGWPARLRLQARTSFDLAPGSDGALPEDPPSSSGET